MSTASTPDPDRVSARRRCLSVAGHCSSGWDLGVYIDADVTMRTHVTNTVRACFAALCQISSVQRALPQHALPHAGLSSSCHQVGPVRLGSCGYFWVLLQDRLQSVLNAVAGLGCQNTLLHCFGSRSASSSVVCSGVSLCAWHSTSVSGRQPAADIRRRSWSSSSFCRQLDAAGAVNSSGNTWRPCVSRGCSAGMEQSASTGPPPL